MARARVIGKCWVCQGPVYPYQAERVVDTAVVSPTTGFPTKRLVHRGECRDRAQTMLIRPLGPRDIDQPI